MSMPSDNKSSIANNLWVQMAVVVVVVAVLIVLAAKYIW